jgi:hypothetical protein
VIGNPFPLKANAGKSFQGSIVLGKGFIITPEQAQALIEKDKRNRDVLFPYLNGDDLNNDPLQRPSRWVINFFDWSEEKASTYPDCFEIVEQLVKPERLLQNDRGGKEQWWRFLRPRKELYETISQLDQVMAIALTSKTVAIALIATNQVFSHSLGVFSNNGYPLFAFLQSTFHNIWAWLNGSSMKSDLRYTPSVCFETFPLPNDLSETQIQGLSDISKKYNQFRANIMHTLQIGLTKTYNLFHENKLKLIIADDYKLSDRSFEERYGKSGLWLKKHCKNNSFIDYNNCVAQIEDFRNLHIKMDGMVIEAYGWDDLTLKHEFYELEYLPENDRLRFTINPSARKEIVKRLILLNHKIQQNETTIETKSKRKKLGKSSQINDLFTNS